jgi:hypothetical protein
MVAVTALLASPLTAHAQGNGAAAGCVNLAGDDRVAVMNALRGPVSSDLKSSVEFRVERARVCGSWTFVLATPQQPGGASIRWAGTPCAGDTSHLVGGLLRRNADGWALIDYALCPSDVAWADWPERYKAPRALFEE